MSAPTEILAALLTGAVLAALVAALLAGRRARKAIRLLSSYDPLTALPNRQLFRDHLAKAVARARATREPLAVLLLDLDDLSKLNDSMGHDAADRFLVVLVERLAAGPDPVEMLARAGGDEFAVLLSGEQAGAEAAGAVAQRLIDTVCRPAEIDGHDIHLGASVGIALYPTDGGDAETVLKNAEIAMYRAMREAPNGFRFFAPRMDAELAARRRLEHDLRRAVARGELALHYQPQVDIATRRIIGFEALLRWQHDGHAVPPARFVPLAEEAGLIGRIGEWVLREACRQASAWKQQGLPPVTVSVNVSAMQFRRADLAQLVGDILAETGLEPGRLELELTESAVMADPAAAERLLTEVRAMGVRLAIDDFGTGYSSLARLKRFPVDTLKIDRSFVSDLADDPNDAAIARAIIHLGHALGLSIVSEGVETEPQLDYLAAEGCDTVQGWLFSAALPADKAAELLAKGGF